MKKIYAVFLLLMCFGATKAQLVINEVSNGPSGAQEYVELLVVGTPSGCTQQCVDLRGWILDDNNGSFASGTGTGIATGHMRFANNATWSCVPIGTIIVVYNDADRNPNIPADNLTGANCTYIVPASSTLFEKNTSTPIVNGVMTYGGPYTSGGSWTTQGLSNTDDSYQIRDPANTTVPYHAVSYGNNTTGTIIYFAGAGGGEVYSMTNNTSNDPFLQANWTKAAVAGNETPGAPNNAANAAWISTMNNNCMPLVTPVVDAGPDVAICSGSSTTLTATCNVSGGTYTWSNGLTGASISVSPTGNTTYNVTFDNGGGCTSTDAVLVTVNSTPTVTAGPDRNVCSGQTVLLVATGTPTGGSYLWSDGTANDSLLINPSGTTTYHVTYTNASGCADTDTVVVNYFTNPVVNITAGPTICSGDTVALVASTSGGIGNFNWSDGHSGATDSVAPLVTTNYSVTFTSSLSGCSGAAQTNVTVNTTPTVYAGPDQTICSGQTANLGASAPVAGTYQWSNGQSGPNISVSPLNDDTLAVVFTSNTGCTATDTLLIFVNPTPTVTVTPSTATFCAGGSTTLTANGSTTGSYLWSDNETTPSITVSPTSSQHYIVTFTANSGCTASDSAIITVNPLPIISAGNDTAICSGSSANLLATSSSSGTYSWSNSVNTASNPVSPTSSTTYDVTFTDANGCTATDGVSVTVNPLPIASAGSNVTTCPGADNILTATGGTSYVWSNSATTDTIHVSPPSTTTYDVTVTDANSCTATASVTVNIDPSLFQATALTQDLSCFNVQDGQVRIVVTVGNSPYSYVLTDGTNNYGPSSDSSFNNLQTGTYTATVTDSRGCLATLSNLVVNAPPAVAFNITSDRVSCNGNGDGALHLDNDTLRYSLNGGAFRFDTAFTNLAGGSYTIIGQDTRGCSDTVVTSVFEPAVLQVTITPDTSDIIRGETVSLNANVTGGTEPFVYTWLPDSSLSCPDCSNPIASPLDTTSYTLLVTDSANCMDSTFAYITVHRPFILTFPSAFSPNNDGHNDKFRAITNGTITNYDLKIYNRWGELVFETTKLTEGWDGKFKGADQPNSTFVWLVEYVLGGTTETVHAKGNLTLVR